MLPRLNLTSPLKHHIFDAARPIKEVGIDGWRLDVAHEIHPDFWRSSAQCTTLSPAAPAVGAR